MKTITITLDLTAENLEKLKAFLPEQVWPEEITKPTVTIPKEEPVTETKEEPVAKEEPQISKSDIRAAALALSKSGKKDALSEIFKKYGGKKLSDFDNRPDLYGAMMKDLVDANA